MQSRILIAGAGIGGLTTALCLAKSGHQVTVIERRERLEEAGAGIQISPNASRVLVTLGLGAALDKVAVPGRKLVVRRFTGSVPVIGMALDELSRRYRSPYWLLRRSDLQNVLLEAAAATPGIAIHYGRTIDAAEETPDGLSVQNTAGDGTRSHQEVALLIGADGLWSSVGGMLGGKAVKPGFTGYEAWRALVPLANVPATLLGPDVALWLGAAAHVVTYPVSGGSFFNIVLVRKNAVSETGWTRAGDPASLAPLLERAAPDLRRLLERVANWQVWSLFDAPARIMAGGRIALVGDAAHPVLPFLAQGAALAIEDAAALTACLGHATLADEAALKRNLLRYDRERRPRAETVQRAARGNGKAYHLRWPASLVRDQAMAFLGSNGMIRRYHWLYGLNHQQF